MSEIYAPDYLRQQEDVQLVLLADTMEHLVSKNHSLQAENKILKELIIEAIKDHEERELTQGWHDLQIGEFTKALKRINNQAKKEGKK